MSSTERTDPRGKKIAEQLDGYLDEGQAFLVRCEDEVIRVYDADDDVPFSRPSTLRESHPDLYGRMLSLNASLASAGGALKALVWIASLAFLVGVATGWIEKVLPIQPGPLQNWVVYAVIVALAIFLTGGIGSLFKRLRFGQMRTDLQRDIDGAGMTVNEVLAEIEGDGAVSEISGQLKRDPGRRELAY